MKGPKLKSVTVKRIELLEKLRQNRETHLTEYETALTKYRDATIDKLTEMLRIAKAGGNIESNTKLVEPQSKVVDYDRSIRMLEMSVDDNIELTGQEFDCYVLDNWAWKATVDFINKSYIG